jgi:hypothetical protein
MSRRCQVRAGLVEATVRRCLPEPQAHRRAHPAHRARSVPAVLTGDRSDAVRPSPIEEAADGRPDVGCFSRSTWCIAPCPRPRWTGNGMCWREPRRPCALAGVLTSTIPSTRPLSPQHPGHSHDKKQAVTAQHTPTRHGPSPSGRPMPHRSHLIDQLPLVGQVILCWPGVLSASSQRVGGIGWFERMMSPGSTAALMRRRRS